MLYNKDKSLGYLAKLHVLEEAHQAAVHEATGIFLAEALAVKKGDVVEVGPHSPAILQQGP